MNGAATSQRYSPSPDDVFVVSTHIALAPHAAAMWSSDVQARSATTMSPNPAYSSTDLS